MSAPHAPTRSCGHGMVGWDMEMDSQVDMRVMRAPAGRIHRPRDSRNKACCYTLFRRRYHPPPDDAPGDTGSSNKLPREEARDRTLMISDCFFCHAAIRTRTFSRRL